MVMGVLAGCIILFSDLIFEVDSFAMELETTDEREMGGQTKEVTSTEGTKQETESDSYQDEEKRKNVEERIWQEFDFSEIDEVLLDLLPKEKIEFGDVVHTLTTGDLSEAGKLLAEYIKEQLFYALRSNKESFILILVIIIIAAVFSNFSEVLENRQVSNISFYVLYILLITVCLHSFQVAMGTLSGGIENLLDFMRVLCPAYFMAVALSTGTASAMVFYHLILILIYGIEFLILYFMIPIVNVYVLLQVVDKLFKEQMFSEFAGLLRKFISWGLKSLLGIVVGINLIQGLLSPVLDSLQRSTLKQMVEYIPGVGNIFSGVTEVVLGTTVLIKNSIGIGGILLLLFIGLSPIIQIALLTILYKFIAAFVQPVSDRRITGCISSLSEGYDLMLKVHGTVLVLFLLTIAVVAAATS